MLKDKTITMDSRSHLPEIAKLLEPPKKLPRLKSLPDVQNLLSTKRPGKWMNQEKIKKAQIRKLLLREATATTNRLLTRRPPKLSSLIIPTESIHIETLLKELSIQRAPPIPSIFLENIKIKIKKYLNENNQSIYPKLLNEVEKDVSKCSQKLWLNYFLKGMPNEIESSSQFKSNQYFDQIQCLNFKRICARLEIRLLINQPYIRASVATSQNILPEALLDIASFRRPFAKPHHLNDLQVAFRCALTNIRHLITNQWYPRVTNDLLYLLKIYPVRYRERFFALATLIITDQVVSAIRRTIDLLLLQTKDRTLIPNISIDLHLKQDGICNISPSLSEIHQVFHDIIDGLTSVGQGMPSLEFWMDEFPNLPNDSYLPVRLSKIYLAETHVELQRNLDEAYSRVCDYVTKLSTEHAILMDGTLQKQVESFLDSSHTLEQAILLAIQCENKEHELQKLPANVFLIVVKIGLRDFAKTLIKKAISLRDQVLAVQLERLREDTESIAYELSDLETHAKQLPENPEEMVQLAEYMDSAEEKIENLIIKLGPVTQLLSEIMMHVQVPQEVRETHISTVRGIRDVTGILKANSIMMENERSRLEAALSTRCDELTEKLIATQPRLVILNLMDNINNVDDYKYRLQLLMEEVSVLEKEQIQINYEEGIFKLPLTLFPQMDEINHMIKPLIKLIELCRVWIRTQKLWLDGPFSLIEPKKLIQKLEGFNSEGNKWLNLFKDKIRQQIADNFPRRFLGNVDDPDPNMFPAPIKLCSQLLSGVQELMNQKRLIYVLGNRSLKSRHWSELGEIVGRTITPNAGTSLRKLLELNLTPHTEEFEVVSLSADKELALRIELKEMRNKWQKITIPFLQFNKHRIVEHPLYKLHSLYVEHDTRVKSMRGGAFVRPLEQQLHAWGQTLCCIDESLMLWARVQAKWLSFVNLMACTVINKKLNEEARLFIEIEINYFSFLTSIESKQNINYLDLLNKGLLENLRSLKINLEIIDNGINQYLNKKRTEFPRFFLLSNHELLEILSQTQVPNNVNKHIQKIFPGIKSLIFDEQLSLVEIKNELGEVNDLIEPIITTCFEGCVEKWLIEFENEIKRTLILELKLSLEDYEGRPLSSWILHWPLQISLLVSKIFWTGEIELCYTTQRWKNYSNRMSHMIDEMINYTISCPLKNSLRDKLYRTICWHLQARDIIEQLLLNGDSRENYLWLSQMRYYRINEEEIEIQSISNRCLYGFEYIGQTITNGLLWIPTFRYYNAILLAHGLQQPLVLKGAPGTGKTSIARELANELGWPCFTHTLQEENIDFKSELISLIKAASSGLWICLLHAHLLSPTHLSIISNHFLANSKTISDICKLDESETGIVKTGLFSLTWTTGYNQSEKLPDSLLASFRPIAISPIDLCRLIEISLKACGFCRASELARKINSLFNALQDRINLHWTLRELQIIISRIIEIKESNPDESEEKIILKAIRIFCIHIDDKEIFQSILQSIFQTDNEKIPLTNKLDLDKIGVLEKLKLHPEETFIEKIYQGLDMIKCKNSGLIINGEPGNGKSSILKILSQVYEVSLEIINSKTVILQELIGRLDINNHWQDGIITETIRKLNSNKMKETKKWFVFDGPLESNRMEYLNSLLDDRENFTLFSGETISKPKGMKIIFETCNLEDASPSIVSRCCILYTDSREFTWKPLLCSWLKENNWNHQELFFQLFNLIFSKCLTWTKNIKKEMCCYSIYQGVIALLDMIIKDVLVLGEDTKTIQYWIQAAFILSIVWGLGNTLEEEYLEAFDIFFKSIWNSDDFDISLPNEGLIQDYFYNFKGKGNWKLWSDLLKSAKIEERSSFWETIVPTVELTRYSHIIELYIRQNVSLIVTGPMGSGKLTYLKEVLRKQKLNWTQIHLKVTSSIKETQKSILAHMNTKDKIIYRPENKERLIYLINDLSQPEEESPWEVIRQLLDQGFWHMSDGMGIHHKVYPNNFHMIAKLNKDFTKVTKRLLRHFVQLNISQLQNPALSKIFGSLLGLAWKKNGFSNDICSLSQQFFNSTLNLWHKCQQDFQPGPLSPHYIFNIRDLNRVIRGSSSIRKEPSGDDKKSLIRIWTHEMIREFQDRLISRDHRLIFFEQIIQEIETIIPGATQYLSKDENVNITLDSMDDVIFLKITELDMKESSWTDMIGGIDQVEQLYVSQNNLKTDIILFRWLIANTVKVARIFSQIHRHCLILGNAGTGRETIVRLASQIIDGQLFEITIPSNKYGIEEWRNDLNRVLHATAKGGEIFFLIPGDKLQNSLFWDDVTSLINFGEIYNQFDDIDERDKILDIIRLQAQGGNRNSDISPEAVFSFLHRRCQDHIHNAICLNPTSPTYRQIISRWSVLNERCTKIWLSSWPSEAFQGIANALLPQIDCEIPTSMPTACELMHITASRYYNEQTNQNSGNCLFITNITYITLINVMVERVRERKEILKTNRERYEQGLQRLLDAEKEVEIMKITLKDMQPLLNQADDRMKEMTAVIAQETDQVAKASELVRLDEQVCNTRAAEAQLLKVECETDLAQAIPILEDAIEALNTLKPTDITLVKSMKNPPAAIKMVMAAVCVMRDVPPDRITDPSTGRKSLDYWGPSKRILGDMYFLQCLKEFDKDNIPEDIMTKIRTEYLPHRDFKPHIVAKASSAAEGLCKWVIAMDMYDAVAKEVAPKKAKLAIAEEAYTSTLRELTTKRAQLADLEMKLKELNEQLSVARTQRKRLVGDEAEFSERLRSAEKLLEHLKNDRNAWNNHLNVLNNQLEYLLGDSLLTVSCVIYFGPLSSQCRKELLNDWQEILKDKKLLSENWNFLEELLGNEYEKIITLWHLNGLPREADCVEHAALVSASKYRWPLITDADGIAKNWLRKMESNNALNCCELSDENYIITLKDCITSGRPALIEFYENNSPIALHDLFNKREYLNNENEFVILIGDQILSYNKKFSLFLIDKSRNPKYNSTFYNIFNIIDFKISIDALTDIFLSIILSKETPKMENKYNKHLKIYMKTIKEIEDLENLILKTLSETKEPILEDTQTIGILNSSKILLSEKLDYLRNIKELLNNMEMERNCFRKLAKHASILYTSLSYLPSLSNNYIYSLDYFIIILKDAILKSKRSPLKERRLHFLQESFTYHFYIQIERSLLEKHKIVFTFLLAALIQINDGNLSKEEFKFLILSNTSFFNKEVSPFSWLDQNIWLQMQYIQNFKMFNNIIDDFEKRIEEWRNWLNDKSKKELISPWQNNLNEFSRMILIKIFKPEYWLDLAQEWLNVCFGNEFFNKYKNQSNLNDIYNDSNCLTKIIIFNDEKSDIYRPLDTLAKKNKQKLQSITIANNIDSEKQAELIIKKCREEGKWVYIRESNHARKEWLLNLERFCKSSNLGNTHLEYRLWIIADQLHTLPSELLENAVKISLERPEGLKSNIYNNYSTFTLLHDNQLKMDIHQTRTWMKLFYSLIVWHTTFIARKDFGPRYLPYSFNENNLELAHTQLKTLLNQNCSNKIDVFLESLVSHMMDFIYGGEMTDMWHRRLLRCSLDEFINEKIICDVTYKPINILELGLPLRQEKTAYLEHIENLPERMEAKYCSLNDYYDIWLAQNRANNLQLYLKNIFKWESFDDENETKKMINEMKGKIPEALQCNIRSIANPIDSVYIQEINRYNVLLKIIHYDINKFLSQESNNDFKISLNKNEIPNNWLKVSYYTIHSLSNFIRELEQRIKFIQKRKMNTELLDIFWLPGFFNPKSFLTAVRQLLAQKAGKTIDELGSLWEIVSDLDSVQVDGLWLQGASLNNQILTETKYFYEKLNPIRLAPAFPKDEFYICPVFNCCDQSFKSYLTKIGLSCHSKKEEWILKEVAIISQFFK